MTKQQARAIVRKLKQWTVEQPTAAKVILHHARYDLYGIGVEPKEHETFSEYSKRSEQVIARRKKKGAIRASSTTQ